MKMITGLIEMISGEMLFTGDWVHKDPIAWTQQRGDVPEEPYLDNHFIGREYLMMVGQLRGLPSGLTAEAVDHLLRWLGRYD